jgi:predicted enzyme related to lactoylglutathione lyase
MMRVATLLTIGSFVVGCRSMPSSNTQPSQAEKRVTSVGGIFFTSEDPEQLKHWYQTHLGLAIDEWGTNFEWRQADDSSRKGFTQWSPHQPDGGKFGQTNQSFMLNYRVQNLDRLLAQLRSEGVEVVGEVEHVPYGKFAHIKDLEGNVVELWEPNDVEYEKVVDGVTK